MRVVLNLLVLVSPLIAPAVFTVNPAFALPSNEIRASFSRHTLPSYPQKLASENSAKELGKHLFSDVRLSRAKDLSCQSCHMPSFGWVDNKPTSIEASSRRSMPLWNIAGDSYFTWSGKAGSIASQAILAITATKGMNGDLDRAIQELKNDQKISQLFLKAFGPPPDSKTQTISPIRIAVALEIYIRSLVSPITRFDRWIETGKGLSDSEQRGFDLFVGKADCATCHSGWKFTDGKIHDVGVDNDIGAGSWLRGANFQTKTVGLRDVASRPFLMHRGGYTNLRDVVLHYNIGGAIHRTTNELRPLGLSSQEIDDLVVFLKTL